MSKAGATAGLSGWHDANAAIGLYQTNKLKLPNRGESYRWGTTPDGSTVVLLSHLTKCFYVFHAPTKTFFRSVNPGATKITLGTVHNIAEVDRAWLHPLILSAIPAARSLLAETADPVEQKARVLVDRVLEEADLQKTDVAEIEEDEEDEIVAPQVAEPPPAPAKLSPVVVASKEYRYWEETLEVRIPAADLAELVARAETRAASVGPELREVSVESEKGVILLTTVVPLDSGQVLARARDLGANIPDNAQCHVEDNHVFFRWGMRREGPASPIGA